MGLGLCYQMRSVKLGAAPGHPPTGRKKIIFWTSCVSIVICGCYWLDAVTPGGDLHGNKFFFIAAAFHAFHAANGPPGRGLAMERSGGCVSWCVQRGTR
jgi:hypothetical protein